MGNPTGLADGGTTFFLGRARPDGDTGFLLGEPARFGPLLERAATTGLLDRLGWIHLPRGADVPDGFEVRDSWDFRWTTRVPAPPWCARPRVARGNRRLKRDQIDGRGTNQCNHRTLSPGTDDG